MEAKAKVEKLLQDKTSLIKLHSKAKANLKKLSSAVSNLTAQKNVVTIEND